MNKNLKIGIMSCDINTPMFNYGALLHTWAFERFLNQNGYSNVENIDYSPEAVQYQNRLFPVFDLFTNTHRRISLNYCLHYFHYLKKLKKIYPFSYRKIKNSKRKYKYSNIGKCYFDYDIIIAEDDVIWSPNFLCKTTDIDPAYFLAIPGMSDCRKISYAASMSDCNFKVSTYEKLKTYLSDFDKISVREKTAVKFLREKIGISADCVLDAVFLLKESDYYDIISERFKNVGKYILLYLPADDNVDLRIAAQKYAEKHGLQIIEVTNKIYTNYKKGIYGDCGVEDFLSALYNATVVFTNSFHALCFSIIFKKEFYIFSRSCSKKNLDLCELLGLKNRYCSNNNEIHEQKIEYDCVYKRLQNEIDFSKKWLLEAISGRKDL